MSARYNVYVIELDREVRNKAKFRKINPRMGFRSDCLYVGSTVRTPELRFEQHKQGYKSNPYARKFGERLRPDLYEKYNPIPSRKEAEELEAYLAKRLRADGYGVWQG
jgi:GIY-YIG catalytic domain